MSLSLFFQSATVSDGGKSQFLIYVFIIFNEVFKLWKCVYHWLTPKRGFLCHSPSPWGRVLPRLVWGAFPGSQVAAMCVEAAYHRDVSWTWISAWWHSCSWRGWGRASGPSPALDKSKPAVPGCITSKGKVQSSGWIWAILEIRVTLSAAKFPFLRTSVRDELRVVGWRGIKNFFFK